MQNNQKEISTRSLSCGDRVWAWALQETKDKEGHNLIQKPVYGIMALEKKDIGDENFTSPHNPAYFIPFNKNGKPSFYKAVRYWSRSYAATEEDAAAMFNEKVQSYADYYRKMAEDMEALLITEGDTQ